MKRSKLLPLVLIVLVAVLAACSGNASESTSTSQNTQSEVSTDKTIGAEDDNETPLSQIVDTTINPEYDQDDLNDSLTPDDVVEILLSEDGVTFEGDGIFFEDSVVTVTAGGTYTISGKLEDGQIIVDTGDNETVRLILNGVNLTSSTSAPIYAVNADKIVITLAAGTENIVTDERDADLVDGAEPGAAIFSNDDLTINGSGSLTVNANANNGIDSDDDLIILSGNITVNATNDGVKGRDSLTVKDSIFSINAGGDGLQSNNDVDDGEGNVIIEGGQFIIHAEKDGIQAETLLTIYGGVFVITTGGGSQNANMTEVAEWGDWDQQNSTNDSDVSTKGLKSAASLIITGGSFEIDSLDDAVHSNNALQIDDGSFLIASGDDGIHADTSLVINGGTIDITTSYEGMESAAITINDGTIHVDSYDDGINAVSGIVGESMGGRPGMDGFGSGDSTLVVNGGYIYVDANGDGVDINGSIDMTDGTLIINGPVANMNGAIDYLGYFDITGGLLVAVGSAGMAQSPSQSSSQYSVMVNFNSVLSAGTMVHIESQSGENILTFAPSKDYQSLVVSSPELSNGESYVLLTGGSASGSVRDGLYSNSDYQDGSQIDTFEISSILTMIGSSGGFMENGGMPGRGGGRRP